MTVHTSTSVQITHNLKANNKEGNNTNVPASTNENAEGHWIGGWTENYKKEKMIDSIKKCSVDHSITVIYSLSNQLQLFNNNRNFKMIILKQFLLALTVSMNLFPTVLITQISVHVIHLFVTIVSCIILA